MKTRFLFLMAICMLAVTTAMAQITVKGQVLSATDGEGLIGAAVQEVGTSNGAVTDVNGNFSLKVKEGASLKISYVGYISQTVRAAANLVVKLQEDTKVLDDVLVVGYGVQKKSDVTGAVASVKEADLRNRSTTDAAAALQGKAAGIQIINTSGAPGEAAKIRVRGYSSNSGELGPLLIVDGAKVDNIQYLDPSMIESMEVLKDAASAAIYGAQAGNGVVLITTKTGNSAPGLPSFTYNAKFTAQSLAKKAELFGADEYIKYQKAIDPTFEQTLKDNGYNGESYNWFDQVFEPSWSQQHSLTFQGGNEKGHFLGALNYVKNNGIVKGDDDVYNRFTAQINADYQITKWLKVGTNNSIEKWSMKSVSQYSYGSMLNSVMSLDPLTPDYYDNISDCAVGMQQHYAEGTVPQTEDGRFYATSKYLEEATGNPLFQRDKSDRTRKGFTLRGSAYANITPFAGFVFTSRISYRFGHSNEHNYEFPYWLTGMASSANYTLSANNNTNSYYNWENFANYTKSFGKHNLGAMIGMSYEQRKSDNLSISSQGPDILQSYQPNFRYIDYLKSDATKAVSGAPSTARNISYFGRLTYNYDDRYYLQANFRADAFDLSKLSTKERWGYFPSFSAGWTVSNEKFFKDNVNTDTFNFLKIRASWGRNGNVNVLNDYKWNSTIALNSQWYQYSDQGTLTYGSAPSGAANPELMWETSEQFDLGFDARFFNNRLTFGFDWYRKTTKDLLVKIAPMPETGYKESTINGGKVLNSGFEFELGWKDNIGDLKYSVNANLATLHNEVKNISNKLAGGRIEGTVGGVSGLNNKIRTAFEVGQPIWYFRGYKYAGTDDQGAPLYYNAAGEKVAQVADNDLQYIGSAIPDVTCGLTVNLEYKGFDFTVFGTGSFGNDVFSLLYSADRPRTNTLNTYFRDSWTPENTNAKYANVQRVASDWTYWSSDVSLFDGSYFKIKQIQLGYTLPKSITQKANINNLRLFVSLDDFFTITSYPGCDPETAQTANASDMGYDAGTYPTTKKVVLGVTLSF